MFPLVPLLISPEILLGGLVLFALLITANAWLRPTLQAMAAGDQAASRPKGLWNLVKAAYSKGLLELIAPSAYKWLGRQLSAALREVEHYVLSTISRHVGQQLGLIARYLHGWATWSHGMADYIADNAQQTYKALHHLRHVTLPRAIHAAVKPVQDELDDFERVVTGARVAIEQGLAGIGRDVVGGFDDAMGALVKAFDQVWKESYNAIFPKVNELWDDLRIQWNTRLRVIEDDLYGIAGRGIDWIRKTTELLFDEVETVILPRLTAAEAKLASLEALFAGALTIAGLEALLLKVAPNLFCRNTKALTKAYCGLPDDLADLLALELAAVAGILSINELAKACQSITGEVVSVFEALTEP